MNECQTAEDLETTVPCREKKFPSCEKNSLCDPEDSVKNRDAPKAAGP